MNAALRERLMAALELYERTGDHNRDTHRSDPETDCPACAGRRWLEGQEGNVSPRSALAWLNGMLLALTGKVAPSPIGTPITVERPWFKLTCDGIPASPDVSIQVDVFESDGPLSVSGAGARELGEALIRISDATEHLKR